MKEPETPFARAMGEFKATAVREHGPVVCEAAAAQALNAALGEPGAGGPLPPLDRGRSEKILEVLAPFLDAGDSRSAPDWAVEIYRLLALEPAPGHGEDARDAARWRRFASSPQTALMLGSALDPNAAGIDWKAECDRLLDGGVPGLTG